NGTPPDIFERVFAKLDPPACARSFGRGGWGHLQRAELDLIGIDRKSARAARKVTVTGSIHSDSTRATANLLTLEQLSVPEASNEIAVVPELWRARELSGAIVMINAARCRVENAGIIASAWVLRAGREGKNRSDYRPR